MKKHEKKPYSIDEAETHRSGEMKNVDDAGTGTSSVKCTNIDFEKLERNVECEVDEFNRNIELGRNLKIIIEQKSVDLTHMLCHRVRKKNCILMSCMVKIWIWKSCIVKIWIWKKVI